MEAVRNVFLGQEQVQDGVRAESATAAKANQQDIPTAMKASLRGRFHIYGQMFDRKEDAMRERIAGAARRVAGAVRGAAGRVRAAFGAGRRSGS